MIPWLIKRRFHLSWSATLRASRQLLALVLTLSILRSATALAVEVSFRNDVMAVLSKAGCNAGACHGNANGKGGFKLSLRGEDLQFDFNALTRDQFGRRINLLEPEKSLVLLKPTTQIAHEGGKRFAPDAAEYDSLRQWIASGARTDSVDVPKLLKLSVTPQEKILIEPVTSAQLQVRATFSDGSERDVTRLAVYEPAAPIVNVSHDGLVSSVNLGETTVLVRYLNQQVPVRLAFIPERPGFRWKKPASNNYIDEQIFSKLRSLRINPSELSSDEVFLRRAYLDLLGVLPTSDEARAFVASRPRDKRAKLIDRLLERPEFADFWALKWADLLRVEERTLDQKGMQNFHRWLRESIARNKPLDQFVRELIDARGSTYLNPPANFYRANRDPVTRAEAVAQVFLGTRLQCAQCHNHPFDRWTQNDYYDWTALFAKVQYKALENRRQDDNDGHEFKGEQIVYLARKGEVKNPRTDKPAIPRMLGAEESLKRPSVEALEREENRPASTLRRSDAPTLRRSQAPTPEGDELTALAAWITSPTNPFFARAQVNRVWFHLMGRGLVDPIDDFRATNPASHPALLDALAQDFVRHRFDLHHAIRLIMNSRAYQLSSEPNETNRDDEMNYSHVWPRRLSAEQLLDAQHQVAGVTPAFTGYPAGIRASQLPGVQSLRPRRGRANSSDQFLMLFGKPPRLLTCECERSSEPTMSQAFNLISGPALNQLLTHPDNRVAASLASGKTDPALIEELYWAALTRAPTSNEVERMKNFLSGNDRRAALEDLTWSLLNAKEFILRR